ncbi:hypothetical protein KIH23_13415 [Flavobacterium sp. CYK-55]|uniref:hypothetical protein n=1 Tax=Flavobacterium sp. CYK-55 TaxID=2835529 RepID=UPI001BD10F65|nr:hypothetical protein [Flavobacterium sp. CYK-55]MBS7788301.1 hypothetical protein [Flavobacterium sp. CYK-55]
MKYIQLSIFLLALNLSVSGQNKLEKLKAQTVEEGKKLYASEMASWYGTDLFVDKYKDRDKIGGYFSYVDNPKKSTCVFYGKGENPKIIGTMVFDETYNVNTADYNLLEREMTELEKDYYSLRLKTQEYVRKDTIFKRYENTTLNVVPLIDKDERKVYLLTGYNGSKKIVVYGNDYLITFDKNNNIKEAKKLHASYLPFEYGDKDGNKTIVGMHSHVDLSGDLISPTDICTTMLYKKLTNWETYYVISKKYVSIWDCKNDNLVVMTRKAWDRMNKEIEKRK